jgi:serine protease AprX
MPVNRRTFVKGAGVAAGAAALPGTGAARIDDAIDLDGGLQEIIVVFEKGTDLSVLDRFGLPDGYYEFEALQFAYTRAAGAVIEEISRLSSVRSIDYNHEIELHNEGPRRLTGAETVHDEYDITGDGIHVAMIDSGLSPHPDLVEKIEHNYRYVNPLADKQGATWVDAQVADVDDIGHGSHVAGTISGTGAMSSGTHAGTGRGVDKLTSYRVDGPTGLFVNTASALDHLLARQRAGDVDVQLINNSWGWGRFGDFNPTNAVNLAFWELYKEGVMPLFSAGNDSDFDTLNPYARAPYVLAVAATNNGEAPGAKTLAGFSSQGRPPAEQKEDGYARGFKMDYGNNEGAHYDRKTALKNVQTFHADDPSEAPAVEADYETQVTGTTNTGAYTLVGPVTQGDPGTAEWTSPPNAGLLRATATWQPRNMSVEVAVYPKGNPDNEIGGPYPANVNNGQSVIEFEAPIEPETDYVFEFSSGEVTANADVTVEIEVLQDASEVDGPLGVYRPGVGAPGSSVVSTMLPSSVLWGLGVQADNPFYSSASGTSMSCPATTGVAALVYQAYKQEAGFYPKPVDAMNILEATAEGGTEKELPRGQHRRRFRRRRRGRRAGPGARRCRRRDEQVRGPRRGHAPRAVGRSRAV